VPGVKLTMQVFEFGGASRDRTDGLVVANEDVRQLISLTRLYFPAEYGPLRSNSTILPAGGCLNQPKAEGNATHAQPERR
jgi:hypothetical protein